MLENMFLRRTCDCVEHGETQSIGHKIQTRIQIQVLVSNSIPHPTKFSQTQIQIRIAYRVAIVFGMGSELEINAGF